jgi:hypothetical protein
VVRLIGVVQAFHTMFCGRYSLRCTQARKRKYLGGERVVMVVYYTQIYVLLLSAKLRQDYSTLSAGFEAGAVVFCWQVK